MYVKTHIKISLLVTLFFIDEGGHTKNNNVTELMEQPRRSNNTHFFQGQQQPKKPLSSSNIHTKNNMGGQDSIHFFGNTKRNYEQPSNDEFNVWSENPISHEVSLFFCFVLYFTNKKYRVKRI